MPNHTPQQIAAMMKRAICLFDENKVHAALDEMASDITKKLKDENPLFLCVMNGAVITMGQLMTRLQFPLQIDYIQATRYRGKTVGGELEWIAKPRISVTGRHVVLVEDILDTGLTLAALVEYCREQGAHKVFTASLVDKDHPRAPQGVDRCDFTGLYAPDKFLIGYGLDYAEYFRNMPGIYVLADQDLPA